MALTCGAALKQWIETMGFTGFAVSSRISKIPARRPYITIMDQQPLAPGPLEDGGPGTAVETCIIDVWQDWKTRARPGNVIEDQTVVVRLIKNLQGGRPVDVLGHPILATGQAGTGVIYRTMVRDSHQFNDPTIEQVVHNSITVNVWRQL